jgi:hypothetical protein
MKSLSSPADTSIIEAQKRRQAAGKKAQRLGADKRRK